MSLPTRSRFRARLARGAGDMRAVQRLRQLTFRGGALAGMDEDRFDDLCLHVLVEQAATGALVCCFRILPLAGGAQITRSYSAQFYDLSALVPFAGPIVEIGRFCIHPDWRDPDILRVAWAELTAYVDTHEVTMLFGCSSFAGTDAARYLDAFAMLRDRHLAPRRWGPRIKAPLVYRYAQAVGRHKPDARAGLRGMPPLLRTYLGMGGWVSDHAVIDRQLNTLHVFTGVEIATIPAARKRLLRASVQALKGSLNGALDGARAAG